MNWVITHLVGLVLPTLLGAAVVPLMAVIKKFSGVVDAWPDWAKRTLVTLLAFGVTAGAAALGVPLPCNLTSDPSCSVFTLPPDVWVGILSALAALGIHALQKPTAPPAGAV